MKRQARPGPNRGRKKPKDMPRRPLSAYNIFFKQERPVLIARYEKGESQPDFQANMAKALEAGKDKEKGAVFQAASRTLAERWKVMAAQEREPYERQADEALKKYRKEIAEYQQKKESQKREEETFAPTDSTSSSSLVAEGVPLAAAASSQLSFSTSAVKAPPSVMPMASSMAAAAPPPALSNPLEMFQQALTQPQPQGPNTNDQNLVNAAMLLNLARGGQSSANAQRLAYAPFQTQGVQLPTNSNQFNTGQAHVTNLASSLLHLLQSCQTAQHHPQQQHPIFAFAAALQSAQAQNGAATAVSQEQHQAQPQPPQPQPQLPTSNQAHFLSNVLGNVNMASPQLGEKEQALLRQLLLEELRRNGGAPP